MQLKSYLCSTLRKGETMKLRYTRFANELGVSLPCIHHWLYGQRRINDAMKLKIVELTKGKVTIVDLVRG